MYWSSRRFIRPHGERANHKYPETDQQSPGSALQNSVKVLQANIHPSTLAGTVSTDPRWFCWAASHCERFDLFGRHLAAIVSWVW